MTRSGFTLVEVMVALLIASLLGLAVAGTVTAAIDTRERIESRRLEVRSGLAWRAVVTEALRNTRPPAAPGDTALLVMDGTGPDGAPADRMVFLTEGVLPPLTEGVDWVVSLEPAEDGVRLMAAPVGVRARPVRIPAPAHITGLEVEVLDPSGRWLAAWDRYFPPRAVRITFWSGMVPGASVLVRIPAVERPL